MSFVDTVKNVLLNNYMNFEGRARRSEYWYFYLFTFLAEFILGRSSRLFGIILSAEAATKLAKLLVSLFNLAVFLPTLGVSIRRLHDTGKSGWYMLWNLLPLVGSIIVLIRMAREGDQCSNEYGPDPKGVVIF